MNLKNFQYLPPALEPIYTTQKISESILLYKGCLKIKQDGSEIEGEGEIKYKWFPYSQVAFSFECQSNDVHIKIEKEATLELESKSETKVFFSGTCHYCTGTKASGGISEAISIGSESNISFLIFHLVNFNYLLGNSRASHNGKAYSTMRARNILEAKEWKLTLDVLNNTHELISEVDGGFAITHVGKLERSDGSNFSGEEGAAFLDKCAYFFSFIRGFEIPIILLVGHDSNNQVIWKKWESRRGSYWRGVNSWFPIQENQVLSQIFPDFIDWLDDWGNSAKIILEWYITANINSAGLEGSIVSIQVALELLAWTILVEKGKNLSNEGFEKLWASDQIRLLLTKFNIPCELPPSTKPRERQDFLTQLASPYPEPIPNLVSFNSPKGRSKIFLDGPHAFTEIRNSIIHPKKSQKLLGLSPTSSFEVCSLGIWYLEMVLLAIFGYQGRYENRLAMPHQCGDTELVPWANEQNE